MFLFLLFLSLREDDKSLNNAKIYADSLVVGLIDDRGSYDASSGLFPTTGGSGINGAIKKGDLWFISNAGILNGVVRVIISVEVSAVNVVVRGCIILI